MGRGRTLYLTVRFTLSMKCVCGGKQFPCSSMKTEKAMFNEGEKICKI